LNFVFPASNLIWPSLLAFGLTLAILPQYINWLKQKQIGQYLREEGPTSHLHKAKTPTAGGACFMAIIFAVTLISLFFFAIERLATSGYAGQEFYQSANPAAVLVLLLSLGCGLLGYLDDMAKVNNKGNDGLSAGLRLRFELLFGLLFAVALLLLLPNPPQNYLLITLPFGLNLNLSSLSLVFLSMFLVAATTNAINLHDGMDGLSTGTVLLVTLVLLFMLVSTGQMGLALVAAVVCGSLLAFLLFNIYPAKIFMGDTGSLFLGGLLAGLAIAGGLISWFVPLALIYIAETISVILQVTYFKLTKNYQPSKPIGTVSLIWLKLTKRLPGEGKRLFRMAPLHHHFEALMAEKGFPEWQVVAGFWLAQLLICMMVLVCFCSI
jgi:phospho-N-acetylmuramoyl-pentapeptide-transferase